MIVGFTGTRFGMSPAQKRALAALLNNRQIAEFRHGDCVGADAEAHEIALERSDYIKRIVIHPPQVPVLRAYCHKQERFTGGPEIVVLRPKPYIPRDRDIVNACSVLIACPRTIHEELRSGTWTTIRFARRQRKHVTILTP